MNAQPLIEGVDFTNIEGVGFTDISKPIRQHQLYSETCTWLEDVLYPFLDLRRTVGEIDWFCLGWLLQLTD